MPPAQHDIIILGGGLAGGLAALAFKKLRPDIELLLIEPGERIGGNHLWSFFESDVAPQDQWLVKPLIGHDWPNYEVRFPAHRRRIDQSYRTIESERLDAAVREALPGDRILRSSATMSTPTTVKLDDGSELAAGAVLDARGLSSPPVGLSCGWQKFLGQSLYVPQGHGLTAPIVMDATVDQRDGYRFVYCLPFSPKRIFVEDTYYSDMPDIDRVELAGRILSYAEKRGWAVDKIEREEAGVLPVVMGGNFSKFWPKDDLVARAGVRGGFFHPLTSYSLPDAVRFATWLAGEVPLDEQLGTVVRQRAQQHWRKGKFDRLLARMLFRAAEPRKRYLILERFYRLPAPLVARFYSGQSTRMDRVRILAGKPPVTLRRAIQAMREKI